MNISIRVDASVHIGSGHVMRCLVLADALKEKGAHITFYTRPQKGDLVDYIISRGFDVCRLKIPKIWSDPKDTADYKAWLQVPENEDCSEFLEKISNVDLVIIDHYGIGHNWETRVKSEKNCKIFAIDDLERKHNADFILDQTLGRKTDVYQQENDAIIMIGVEYALLRPEFAKYRKKIIDKKLPDKHKILLSMGAIDKPNASMQVLKELAKLDEKIETTVLLSNRAPHYSEVKLFCSKYDWITHLDFVENMAKLMSNHTIAIGAPGATSWERACLGIPSILIPLSANQLSVVDVFQEKNIAIILYEKEISLKLNFQLKNLIKLWHGSFLQNLLVCDGNGTKNILDMINKKI